MGPGVMLCVCVVQQRPYHTACDTIRVLLSSLLRVACIQNRPGQGQNKRKTASIMCSPMQHNAYMPPAAHTLLPPMHTAQGCCHAAGAMQDAGSSSIPHKWAFPEPGAPALPKTHKPTPTVAVYMHMQTHTHNTDKTLDQASTCFICTRNTCATVHTSTPCRSDPLDTLRARPHQHTRCQYYVVHQAGQEASRRQNVTQTKTFNLHGINHRPELIHWPILLDLRHTSVPDTRMTRSTAVLHSQSGKYNLHPAAAVSATPSCTAATISLRTPLVPAVLWA